MFLLFEWIRADPVCRAPLFIDFFRGSNTFFNRFRGYADTVCQMYVLATGCRPLELPGKLADHAK